MSQKKLKKLLQTLQGKKKKKPTKPSARLEALRGKKYFKRGGRA
jgi:RNA polymerase-interacting CarD/CdnL/TRCF family regulator